MGWEFHLDTDVVASKGCTRMSLFYQTHCLYHDLCNTYPIWPPFVMDGSLLRREDEPTMVQHLCFCGHYTNSDNLEITQIVKTVFFLPNLH